MKKTDQNIKNIFQFLKTRGALSSTELGQLLDMTPVNAFLILRKMLSINLIEKTGKGKNTRYRLRQYLAKWSTSIIADVVDYLIENDYADSEIGTFSGVENALDKHFTYFSPSGVLINGLEGFFAWCHDPKRNIKNYDAQFKELIFWISEYLVLEAMRRKNWFFDWTTSLKQALEGHMDSNYIDVLLFHEVICVNSSFSRTRTGWELFLWKENHDKFLLESAIRTAIPDIRRFIENKIVDGVVYTPPTIPRTVQFAEVLEELLGTKRQKILFSKIKSPDRHLIAQKNLNKRDRVINARENIILDGVYDFSQFHHILILDDNFTTWATMNAIAEKLRIQWFWGTITAMTITGKFHSTVLADDLEI